MGFFIKVIKISFQTIKKLDTSTITFKEKTSLFTKDMILKITVQSFIQVSLLTFLIFFAPVIFNIPSDLDINYREWQNLNGPQCKQCTFRTDLVFRRTRRPLLYQMLMIIEFEQRLNL